MTVQEIVLTKLGKAELCPHIEVAIAEAEAYIKSYCHLDKIPDALHYVWANIAVGCYQVWNKAEDGADPVGPLSSVSMGDTSYSFATDKKTNANYVTEIARDFKAQLNRFRRGLFDVEPQRDKHPNLL